MRENKRHQWRWSDDAISGVCLICEATGQWVETEEEGKPVVRKRYKVNGVWFKAEPNCEGKKT